jgi:hypothetical protein
MALGRMSEWRKLPMSLRELCINTTLRCGQSFRYDGAPIDGPLTNSNPDGGSLTTMSGPVPFMDALSLFARMPLIFTTGLPFPLPLKPR